MTAVASGGEAVPVDDAERRARMVMSLVAEPGDPDACQLVREHSAVALVAQLRARASPSVKLASWHDRLAHADISALERAADAIDARFVCPADDEWPIALEDLIRVTSARGERCGGVPFGLWVRGIGNVGALVTDSVSIVGSRASTAYGDHTSSALASQCCDLGFTIVSGGAYGIDAAAHRGAIAARRPTVAVLAGGPDRLYPSGNIALLKSVIGEGVVIAEAAPGCAPSKSRFLVRNRLIAALSRGTVVVEAALRSGALNTARWALDLDRPVMGVPGPVTSKASAGVHDLLRQPGVLLVTDGSEVVEHISPIGAGLAPRKSGPDDPTDLLELLARRVLDATPLSRPAPTESIARVAGLPVAEVLQQLSELEADGFVVEHGGGWSVSKA